VRRASLTVVRAVLLVGPAALAFFDGGYFGGPRLAAAIVAWVAVAVAAMALEGSLLPSGAARAALAGLAGLAAFTALSTAWAPLGGPAGDSAERAVLYLGAAFAAFLAFRPRDAARAVEPALAAGVLLVIGYGLAGRVLPDVVELERTVSAGGRLDQPLTYWNGEGALAAMGFVLCARIAGDRARGLALRAAAAAAAAPLGLGVYLTFSRGALAALAVGLAVLLALTPTWAQLRAAAIAVEAGVAAAIVSALLPAVEDAEGDDWTGQGLVMLVALLAFAGLAAAAQAWSARAEDDETAPTGPLPRAPRVRALAWLVAAAMAITPFAAAIADRGHQDPIGPAFGAGAERLASAGSNRFEYWEAAVKAFGDDPAVGGGAGSFAVSWLEHREIDETVRDAHSLELETAAELGLIGLALLLLALGGVAAAARRVAREDPGLAAGPAAALAVWAAHSAIDWDWELPALTLVAAVLAGMLLARSQAGPQLGDQPALPPYGEHGEHAGEHQHLEHGLPNGSLPAPQHDPYGHR
jgi:hypothetical protein